MKKNTYVYILIKSDSSSFKIGLSTDLDKTIDYYENVMKFRKDRSFVFSGDYNQMKNLKNLFVSMIFNYKINFSTKELDDIFQYKALDIINETIKNFKLYKIKSEKKSLRKELEECSPYIKTVSRKEKVNLLFDYNKLSKDDLEYKYSNDFQYISNIYRKFKTQVFKPHKKMFNTYLQMKKEVDEIEERLLKII